MSIITPFSKLENKTGKHKDWYCTEFSQILSKEISLNSKKFNSKKFLADFKRQYLELELKQRLQLIADLINKHLEMNYAKKLKVLEKLIGPTWPHEMGMFEYGFYLYPISQFIETYGEEDIELSLKFIEKLTSRFTGEWAIRSLANADEKRILTQMKSWATHENFHVRRLASEGLRARLPWGKKIDWINKDPKKSLPIYNKLRNDPVLYVRRSVANSMGDMIKIDEELAYETFKNWLNKKHSKENLWVIKHAIRHPVKKKNQRFIELKEKVVELMKSF